MTTATAAAPVWSPLWIWLKTKTDATSVLNGRLPGDEDERADLADRAGERERDAREDPGQDVRQDDARGRPVVSLAPSERAASSISTSSSSSTGCTVRTTNGSVTKSSARKIAVRVNATLIPTGDCGP